MVASTRRRFKRLLVSCSLAASIALSGEPAGRWMPRGAEAFPPLPSAFPTDDYTPHGYLDNPFHSMVSNRSGVIRTYPPLGFGWWRTDEFPGAYGGGDRDHVNYVSLLQFSVALGDTVFFSNGDFSRHGIVPVSRYHSKHMLSYDWRLHNVGVSIRCFLVAEHSLGAYIEVQNRGNQARDIRIDATHLYRIGAGKWWGSDGLAGRYDPQDDVSIAKIWAYGDVFVLGASDSSVAHLSTARRDEWEEWIRTGEDRSPGNATTKGRGPLWNVQRYRLHVPKQAHRGIWIMLSRGRNETNALAEFGHSLAAAPRSVNEKLAEDQAFWSACPTLTGSWPDSWRRGWVYDFETLRMTVRPPLGIFKHPWDGMQVHSPRMVLGETSLDMLTLGYASPQLAREVLYGTFADALSPNVPCAREDGSVNMISSDGSECGTAPMWGYPFQIIRALFAATGDTTWVASLYPHLGEYVDWWLRNRTDREGWLHCNNSWESGQDGSRRFLVAEHNEGAVADFVRTVDVESSMAEALETLRAFAMMLGRQNEAHVWDTLFARRIRNARSMFLNNWFRDVDGRTNTPIVLQDHYDAMMLAPLACRIATAEQVDAVRPKFGYFLEHPAHALEWPPSTFTFCEAAWHAGERSAASTAVATIADRVYARTDARTLRFSDPEDPFRYRIPGVANEFWPISDKPPGGENYGWGATLPMFILRNVFGFRETDGAVPGSFMLAPCLPQALLTPGSAYGCANLTFGRLNFDLGVQCRDRDGLQLTLCQRGDSPRALRITAMGSRQLVTEWRENSSMTQSWTGANGASYLIEILK